MFPVSCSQRMSTTRLLPPACPTPENTTSSGGQSPRNPSREYYPIFAVETREYLENLQIDLHHFLEEFVDFACYNKLAKALGTHPKTQG
ncbi:unnamed protein product [Bursaphelenchus xylophilus]|uniref:(pine wood nematode) hypothetical protein n=1 Tax=Bursaphelenchus xylophilus TaxID=6326 RepID=A0A811K7S0_BURXY|nr:unnamed protein product [Bursaphelenchus xylophilus]CAG9088195.1 unnamed protein product [Bursaphelenchus xylophilus]